MQDTILPGTAQMVVKITHAGGDEKLKPIDGLPAIP